MRSASGYHRALPMMPLPFCVYVLFSHKDRLLYTGYTTNIEERLKSHNGGKTKSTAPRRPLELIFCEFYLFEADARKREMYFKTTSGKKAVKLMLGGTLMKFGYNRTAGVTVINEDQ
ncbi:MAG: GIY-YIG nuclease family protein [Cyclobacteriaceae bacterium]